MKSLIVLTLGIAAALGSATEPLQVLWMQPLGPTPEAALTGAAFLIIAVALRRQQPIRPPR